MNRAPQRALRADWLSDDYRADGGASSAALDVETLRAQEPGVQASPLLVVHVAGERADQAAHDDRQLLGWPAGVRPCAQGRKLC